MSLGFSVGFDEEELAANTISLLDQDRDTGVIVESVPGADEDRIDFVIRGEVIASIFNGQITIFNDTAGTAPNITIRDNESILFNFRNEAIAHMGGIENGFRQCIFGTVDQTGLDWCNHQVGDAGSAFYTMKKSLGTIANPTALTDGTKIGGIGAIANDGTNLFEAAQGAGYVGGELASIARGNQTAANGGMEWHISVTPEGTKDRVIGQTWLPSGDVQFNQYPNSRDDGATPTGKVAYLGPGGELRFGNPRIIVVDAADDRIHDSNATFETVATVTAPGGPAGRYMLTITGEYSADITNTDYEGQLTQNGTQLGERVKVEPKDAAGAGTTVDGDNSGTDQKMPLVMRRVVTLAAGNTDDFSYGHRPSANNVEVGTFDPVLTLEYIG